MVEKFDLEKEINRFLTPQKTLAPWIFGDDGKMLADVRRKLLKIADKVILETVCGIDGLEIKDVYLTGSCTGYLWRENSDIDIQIVISNKSCSDFAVDEKEFNKFLASLQFSFLEKYKCGFKFQGRSVDVKISAKKIDFLSLYSIKDDQWLIKPSQDFAKGLTVQEVKEYYLKRKAELLEELEKIKSENEGVELGRKLNEFASKIYNNEQNAKDFFVFKLLHYEELVKPIISESIHAYSEGYRLKLNRKKGLRLKEVRSI